MPSKRVSCVMTAALTLNKHSERASDAQALSGHRLPRLNALEGGPSNNSSDAPVLLLLHGTGCTAKTWLELSERLLPNFRLVIPDLPGHGGSEKFGRGFFSPRAMAAAVAGLLEELEVQPDYIVGHSAGAAIAVQGLDDGALDARGLIALNPALLPFRGLQGAVFSGSAKLLSRLPVVSELIASRGRDSQAVDSLLRDIGSELPADALARYQKLFGDPVHIRAVLMMMAEWDLERVARRLYKLTVPVLLLGGRRDRAVPAEQVVEVARRLPAATVEFFEDGGHLLHEEQPLMVAERMARWCAECNSPELLRAKQG